MKRKEFERVTIDIAFKCCSGDDGYQSMLVSISLYYGKGHNAGE